MKPASLVRLYPPLWRARYGAELKAMLESTPSSPAQTRDVIRAAAWEWIRWTRVGRVLFAIIGGLISSALARIAGAALSVDRIFSASGATLWMWILISGLPYVIPTALIVDAARFNNRRQRFGFWTQLGIIVGCATFVTWIGGAKPGLLSVWTSSAFCLFYLILLFNMERSLMSQRRYSLDR